MWTTSLAHHDIHQEDINASYLRSPRGTWSMHRALDLPHDGFSSCGLRDLKVASRTSRTTLLALQVSAEQSVGWMTAMPSSPPIRPTVLRSGRREEAKTLTDDCSDSGTRPYMPGKRATSRVERAIMLLTALKPDRMGAERARLLNKEQRYPFVVTQSVTQSVSQRSDFLRNTHRQLNGKNPSRYLRGSRPLKGTALRAGPRWLHPS